MQSLPRLGSIRGCGAIPPIRLHPPPRGSARFYSREMFMIASRSEKKEDGFRGFEKKSAALSSVLTSRTEISPSSTWSRTKKCRRATCLVRPWCSGLYERSNAALLSVSRRVEPVI